MKMVRERRLAQGWSQQDLGRRVGCTKQHISELERGEVAPSLKLLYKLAAELGVSASALLADTDSIPDPRHAAH